MWILDHKEGWALKNWCFQTVVLEKTLESHLDSKEMKPVNPKRNQPWIFIGRTDTEAEAPIFWPPDARCQFIGKDPDVGKEWGQGGEEGNRGWDGWMASVTQWTWVWANSRRWWRSGKSNVLWSMGSQTVRHDLAIKQQHEITTQPPTTSCSASSLTHLPQVQRDCDPVVLSPVLDTRTLPPVIGAVDGIGYRMPFCWRKTKTHYALRLWFKVFNS